MEKNDTYPNDLFVSLKKGDFIQTKNLIKNDSKLMNQQNINGKTPLHIVAAMSHRAEHENDTGSVLFFQKLVQYMINNGANPNIKDNKGYYVKYTRDEKCKCF